MVALVVGCGAVELAAVLVEHHAERQLVVEVQPLRLANAELRAMLAGAQAGLRGYSLTGDERMLDTYEIARSEYGLAGDELLRLGADRDSAAAASAQIDQADGWWAVAERQRQAPPGSDEAAAYAEQGEPLFRAFVAANDELRISTEEQAADLGDQAEAMRWVTIAVICLLTVLAAALAVVTAVRTRRRIVGPLTAVVTEAESRAAASAAAGAAAGVKAGTAAGVKAGSAAGVAAGSADGLAVASGAGATVASGAVSAAGTRPGSAAGTRPGSAAGVRPGSAAGAGQGLAAEAWQGPAEIRAIAEALDAAAERAEEMRRNEELVVARLHEIDTVKSDFMSTVSHELRTPLTSISGYVELMRDAEPGQLTASQERMLDVIARNARRLRDLIEDILTLSRIESGDFRTMRGPLDLAEVVLRAVAAVEPTAAKAFVGLHADVRGPVPVRGDSAQLNRVLDNLLSNAVKFTPAEGTVTITVERRGDHALLVIADTGMGIPEDEAEALFGRFFRASNAIRQAVPGTGLGLAIVHTILSNHEGTIEVRSTENVGTTVTVKLPADELVPALSGSSRDGVGRDGAG
ncbi:ATP-binding protein [Paractinoplanes atraurantiacus]|uniref:ATP-binding protein n=1 Tax=Paractinoplanes atraurantiacus TaxID=1036182 RepID=UPI0015CF2CDC|nr:ATP-binding protein [Actinoplanes atraurantiacus]